MLWIALDSYWLVLVTPIPYQMAAALIDGLKSETLVLNDNATRYFPEVHPISYAKAVQAAMLEMEQNQVLSRWCDSSAEEACDIMHHDDIDTAILRDIRILPTKEIPPEAIFQSVKAIGGKSGYFSYNFLWEIRGFIDKAFIAID